MYHIQRERKQWFVIFIAFYVISYYMLITMWEIEESTLLIGTNIFEILAPLIGFVWLVFTYLRAKKEDRFFWLCLSLGSLCSAIAQGISIYDELILKVETAFPGYAHLFWIVMMIGYAAAVLSKICQMKNLYLVVRSLLDTFIIMSLAVMTSWNYIICPALQLSAASKSPLYTFVSLGHPIGDLGLLFGAVMLYLYPGELLPRKSMSFFLSGLSILIFADSVYFYLTTNNDAMGNVIEPLWSLSMLVLGLSGLYAKDKHEEMDIDKQAMASQTLEKHSLVRTLLPYAVIVLLTILFSIYHDKVTEFSLIITVFLLITRQIILVIENRKVVYHLHYVNKELEDKVQQRTRELARSEQQYKSFYEYNPDGVYSLDCNGNFTSINAAFLSVLGYQYEEFINHSFLPLVMEEDREKAFYHFSKAREGESQNYEVSIHNKQGLLIHVNVTNIPIIVDGQVVEVYGIGKDITQQKENQKKINYMAYHDALTGLPNRRLFEERLNQTIIDAERNHKVVGVMFIDLDRFKIINDTLGHDIGDKLLLSVAKRIEGCLRKNDTVARQGGDEFTVLIKDVSSAEDVVTVAKKILRYLNQPYYINEHEIETTPSIGIALYPTDGENATILMKNADTAMYRVKENGKNHYRLYTSHMSESSSRKLMLEKELHKALRNGELVIYYQPQVNMHRQNITGVEALLRWKHPTMGLLSAGEFIPLAEETGLILPIGEWVLRQACKQVKEWQKAGYPFIKVGVNLSPRQFYQDNLIEVVAEVLIETDLPPRCLELEITEGIAMNKAEETIDKLHQLKKLGIHISMDDFGTGYSSLSYLTKFPIDTLKIAREFVSDIGSDVNNEAIVSSIIDMTKNLQLNVIAEGVETEEQSLFLQKHDCNEMQGYLFSEPLHADEVIKMFKKSRPTFFIELQ